MASKFLQPVVALALVAAPMPALAQAELDTTAADTAATSTPGPQGAGLWIGVLMTAVVLGIVIWHKQIFGNNHHNADVPVSP